MTMKRRLTLVLFIFLAGCASAPHDETGKLSGGRATAPLAEAHGGFASALSVSQASAPAAPIIETPTQSSLNGRFPLLSGTGAPGATVQVMESNQINRVVVSTVVGANGRWAASSALELAPGSFSMAGRQVLDGKTSGWGLTRVFTVVDAPTAPVIENPLQGSLNGRYPLISGTGIPGATVQVMQSSHVNNVLVSVPVDAQGQWTGRSALELSPGPFSMAGRQVLDGKTSHWGLTRAFTVVADQPVFKVVEAPAGELNVSTLGANATVQVRYPTLAARDTVGVRLTGVALRDAPIQTVSTIGVLTFNLPKAWIAENLNRTVTLTYTYKVGGAGSLITSSPLSIRVVGTAQGQAVFKVVEAPAGQLNADTLGANATVQVSYPTLAARDTVGVRLAGVTLRDAPIQTVSTVGVLSFSLPKVWITENINRSVNLTFTYKVGGAGSLITSSPLEIRIVGSTAPTDGQRVANELNAQYSNTSSSCTGNKAAFFCNGVLIRVVDASPAFRAWNPSPAAVTLGGVSFSYMRSGLGMSRLQEGRNHGIILKPAQAFTENGGYPLQVLCSFAYDAGSGKRYMNGCGDSPQFPQTSRPCAAQGIATVAAWRAHLQAYPPTNENRYLHQCGFGTDQPSFALSLSARDNPGAEHIRWRQNEIVIKTWPQNTATLPIKAFFYLDDSNGNAGLEQAKFIQRDFYKMTGRSIPVIRVAPNMPAASLFSYRVADQGI
jgi:hypothetical protein